MDKIICGKKCRIFNQGKKKVIFQPVAVDHFPEYSNEIDATIVCFGVDDWNNELSPWSAPAVFKGDDFGGRGNKTLTWLLQAIEEFSAIERYIGGYSLAGLFSLWALIETDKFDGCFSCSSSLWFPGWMEYLYEHRVENKRIYLSLGDKEELTKNKTMALVGECTRNTYNYLSMKNECIYEENPGGHFNDPDGRVMKGIEWIISGNKPIQFTKYFPGN